MKKKADIPGQGDLGFRVDEMTRVPKSDWVSPQSLPNKLIGDIAIDCETNDIGIREGKGAGWAWQGGGYVVGYSVAADNFEGYLPIRHEGGGNLDPGMVRGWLSSVLSDETQVKVGASIMYDLGWAETDGVKIRGPFYDIQWGEALLDEHRWSYSLDSLAKSYLNEEKDEILLRESARAYGVDPKGGLWKLPAPLVGPYGEADATLTRRIWNLQKPRLIEQGMWDLFQLENDLIPLYLDMRRRGVRVNVDRAEQLRVQWKTEVAEIVDEIHRRSGVRVDVWAAASIAKVLDAEGIPYMRTLKTNAPSVTSDFLQRTDHWFTKLILRARERDKLAGTFIDGQILGQVHNGRVHGEIHPLRSDDGGTVSGRLSMSNPNLQFIPVRTKEGKLIRQCFEPEEGDLWASVDVSQQEPRLLVHFASLTTIQGEPLAGALDARDRYLSDPDMSYHDFAAKLTGLDYKAAKILNLAIIYGRGERTTAEQMDVSMEEVKEMFEVHNREMPFAKAMSRICRDLAEERGYIRSILGRMSRFPNYEPADWDLRDGRSFPLWKAKQVWPNQRRFVRARTHKALNALIQSSAADQVKKAMLDVYRAGLGRHVLIQVHDELCLSVPDPGIARQVGEIMKNAVQLRVPVKVDVEISERWQTEELDV